MIVWIRNETSGAITSGRSDSVALAEAPQTQGLLHILSTWEVLVSTLRNYRRVFAAASMAACGLGMFAVPAHAEGSWSSSVTDVRQGFESRRWDDRNSDGASTLVQFSNCTYKFAGGAKSGDHIAVELWRAIDNWPDSSKGSKTLYCNSSATGNWGDVQSSTYYFAIGPVNGWSDWTVSASPVNVSY
jgi:hypothetical protein